jgi:hypothetical protein
VADRPPVDKPPPPAVHLHDVQSACRGPNQNVASQYEHHYQEGFAMSANFKQFLRTLARGPESEDAHVHFHRGPNGAPAVCEDARCDRPRLSL